MNMPLRKQSEARRRIAINPWMEEFGTVPVKLGSIAHASTGSRCVRKWGTLRDYSRVRKPPGNSRLADGWV